MAIVAALCEKCCTHQPQLTLQHCQQMSHLIISTGLWNGWWNCFHGWVSGIVTHIYTRLAGWQNWLIHTHMHVMCAHKTGTMYNMARGARQFRFIKPLQNNWSELGWCYHYHNELGCLYNETNRYFTREIPTENHGTNAVLVFSSRAVGQQFD